MVGFRQLELSRDAAICWQPTTRLSVLEPYGVARSLLAWHLGATPTQEALHELQASLGDTALDDALQQLLEEALGLGTFRKLLSLPKAGKR